MVNWAKMAFPAAIFVCLLCMLGITAAIILKNDGRFIYNLDDPYILLAMSEQIRNGGYGINAGEFAAASSSILYPFLLAPFADFAFHEYVPLIINFVFALGSLAILYRFFSLMGLTGTARKNWFSAIFCFWILFTLNIIGVVFTGMEHGLHILLTLAGVYGVVIFLEENRIPRWLIPVLVIAPLVRYEALAFSVPALVIIGFQGRYGHALAGILGLVAGLGLFSVFLTQIGLEPLPSSILVKSASAAVGVDGSLPGAIKSLAGNLARAINIRAGVILSIVGLFGMSYFLLMPHSARRRPEAAIAALLVAMVTAHLLVGSVKSIVYRYEIYAVSGSILMLLYLIRGRIRTLIEQPFGMVIATGIGMAWLSLFGAAYAYETSIKIPRGANDIYRQQFQMHRFVTEFYNGPVAVNDLGWVAYRNPDYVLDLWGLGSEQARKLRMERDASNWMSRLVASKDIRLAIIYSVRFEKFIPESWELVAILHLDGETTTVGVPHVEFFSTGLGLPDDFRDRLDAFAGTLPDGVRVIIPEAS